MKKFVIVSPRQSCGGPVVLHLLCKLLMEKGYDARIFYLGPTSVKGSYFFYWLKYAGFIYRDIARMIKVRIFKKYERDHRYNGYNYEAVRGCKRKWFPFVDNETIVVYPEIVYGNPLRAQKVVRWFLSFNPYEGDKKAYGENDLIFSFRRIFNDDSLNPECKLLHIVNYDYDLYRQINYGKRSGKCYIIRKGKERSDLPTEFDGPIIDTLSEKEIVKVFNQCEYCISYDTQTFYTQIAAMCGCVSVVIPEEGKCRNDYAQESDKVYGVAYGFSENEINFALETRQKLADKINKFKKTNEKEICDFIKVCDDFFK